MSCHECACYDCAQKDNCASCYCEEGSCDPEGFKSECDDYEVDPFNESNWDYGDDEEDED